MQFCLSLSAMQKQVNVLSQHVELFFIYVETKLFTFICHRSFSLFTFNASGLKIICEHSFEAFNLTIRLGVIDRSTAVFNISVCKECLKLSRNELWAIIGFELKRISLTTECSRQELHNSCRSNISCECNLCPLTVVINECHSNVTSLRSVVQGPNYINS